MGSIQASIDLQDNFTGVILNINRAVEISVARMEQMQAVMSEPVDTSSLYGVGNQVKLVADQVQGLDAAMCGISMPVLEGIQVPVEAVVTQQPQIQIPEDIHHRMDILVNQLEVISAKQAAIREAAGAVYLLPEGTEDGIREINNEIVRMQYALDYLGNNPFQLDSSFAELQIQSISEGLDQMAEKQRRLGSALGNVDIRAPALGQPPQIEVPEGIQIPLTWKTGNLDVLLVRG